MNVKNLVAKLVAPISWLGHKRYYIAFYRWADKSVEYLNALMKICKTFRVSEQTLEEASVSDDTLWIRDLIKDAKFCLFLERDERHYQKQFDKLGVNDLTREQICKLNLCDTLILVAGLMEDVSAMRNSMLARREQDAFTIGTDVYCEIYHKLKELGGCEEAIHYQQAKTNYANVLDDVIKAHKEIYERLCAIKDDIIDIAFSDIYETDDDAELTIQDIKRAFEGIQFSDPELSSYYELRRSFAPMHRLDKDKFFERAFRAHCAYLEGLSQNLVALKTTEAEFYISLAAVKAKPIL